MTLDKIIRNLEDQARDRESSIDKDDPDCIFRRDAEALREAVGLLSELAECRPKRRGEEGARKDRCAVCENEEHCVDCPYYDDTYK